MEKRTTSALGELHELLAASRVPVEDPMVAALDAPLAAVEEYLVSDEAIRSLERDPYWPKWDSPWWMMLLLVEMGEAERIPTPTLKVAVASLKSHVLHFFPKTPEEMPKGKDASLAVMCHCQLGSFMRILRACDASYDDALPWARRWLLTNQMEDGGLNCDEAAYTRPIPRSSVLSTLPPLEAMLEGTERDFTDPELRFLERGAQYLLKRELCRSVSKGGAVIDEAWLLPTFPRYYDYDVLRGLSWVTAWALRCQRKLRPEDLLDAVRAVAASVADGAVPVRRAAWREETTLRPAGGKWERGLPAGSFPLLDAVGVVGSASPWLTREWRGVRDRLQRLELAGLLR